jgi:hypothetical protein
VQTLDLPGPIALAYHSALLLWIVYTGEVCKQNRQPQRHETVLALATLGDVTQIGSFLLAKVSK